MNLPLVNGTAASLALPRRLYPSPGQPVVMLLLGIVLLASGVWMLLHGKGDLEIYATAGFMLVLGGLLGFISAILLVPGTAYLELSSQGFTVKNIKRRFTYSWRDVHEFGIFRMGRTTMVGIRFAEDYRPASVLAERLSKYNRKMTGYDGGIGPYKYGMSHQDLADLLNGLRKRYTGGVT